MHFNFLRAALIVSLEQRIERDVGARQEHSIRLSLSAYLSASLLRHSVAFYTGGRTRPFRSQTRRLLLHGLAEHSGVIFKVRTVHLGKWLRLQRLITEKVPRPAMLGQRHPSRIRGRALDLLQFQ